MTALKQRVLSGLRWQATAKLGGQIVSWGITLLVMRHLAPSDYGLMAMTMVIVGLTAVIAELGLGAALVRAKDATLEFQRQVLGLTLLTNLVLFALLLALAPVSAALLGEPRLWALTAAAGLQLPLAAVCVVPESMAQREMGFKWLSAIELCTQIGGAIATLTLAWSGFGVWSLVIGNLVATSIKSTLLLIRYGSVMPTFVFAAQKSLLGFGGSLTATRVLGYFTSQADIFIAGRMLGPQLLGHYSVAATLASMPMDKVMSVANQVAFSAFAKLQGDRQRLLEALSGTLSVLLVLTTGVLWCMVAAAPDLVPWLLGPKWAASVPLLQMIALVVPLRVAAATLSTALIAAGEVGAALRNTLTAAVIMIPAFIVGAAQGGVFGLALAWIVGYPLFSMVFIWRAKKALGFGFRRFFRSATPAAVAGTSMLLTMLALAQALPIHSAPARVAVLCLVGAAVYLGIATLMDRSLLRHARSLLLPGGHEH